MAAGMAIAALFACRRLALALRRRSRGLAVEGAFAPDWADPLLVQAISLPLPAAGARDGAPMLTVALRDGASGRCLPAHWQPVAHGPSIGLKAVRAPRARAQAAPSVVRERTGTFGTATALVRDRLAPDRNYVLTCGHVVAPDRDAQFRDTARIGGSRVGYLAEWQPAIGEQVFRTGIDAALLEVTRDDAVGLRAEAGFVPAGVGGRLLRDLPVTLRRSSGPLAGGLKIFWSGFVDLPDVTPGYPDYFLTDAIGYATADATLGGDSGAAVWDADDSLLGMHIGALPDAVAGAANAVLSPIGPVLEWFAVQPYTRADPASLEVPPSAVRRRAPPDAGLADDDSQVSVVARTLWGEARGEGERGMRAVGWVIANRVRLHWLGAVTPSQVCLARKQFSCWNAGDSNLPLLDRIERAPDDAFRAALAIAREVVARTPLPPDPTLGATHYIASTLRNRPSWLDGQRPCAVIGNHEFYKLSA